MATEHRHSHNSPVGEKYIHTRSEVSGIHSVNGTRLTGNLRLRVDFAARKHGALWLRINNVDIAHKHRAGNLSAKIEFARELLARCESDAPFLRDLVDSAIARLGGKERALREQVQKCEDDAQKLRDLEL